MSTSKSLTNNIILVLSGLGCLVTLVLIYEHMFPLADVGCAAVGGNCKAVNESDYGHVGKVPTSVFGLAMYSTLIAICLKRRGLMAADRIYEAGDGSADPPLDPSPATDEQSAGNIGAPRVSGRSPNHKALRTLDLATCVIATSALGISWWLQYHALYTIVSFCPWCMASAFLVTGIFVAAAKDQMLDDQKLAGEQKLLINTIAFIGIMTLIMVSPDILRQLQKARQIGIDTYIGKRTLDPVKQPPLQTPDMEVMGPQKAQYTIVEFADYQCPHCKKASAMMSEELKKDPSKFRFAFRNYPLPAHKWANLAAVAAEAAGKQGKFWEMHDYIFAHQTDMENTNFRQERFVEYASDLGLNPIKFEQDETDDKVIGKVARDAATAPLLEVKMTPTFFVIKGNGSVYQLTGMDAMKSAMDDPDNKAWK